MKCEYILDLKNTIFSTSSSDELVQGLFARLSSKHERVGKFFYNVPI